MTQHISLNAFVPAPGSPAPSQEPVSNSSVMEWPDICTDGSLVIDIDGRVRKATPDQQQIAVKAREARAQRHRAAD